MKLDYKCLADYLTAIIALFGFIITICSLIKNNKEKSISNVISLKAELREYNDIYFKLLPNGEWSNLQPNYFNEHENELGKLYSYLGLFEIAYLMINNKILTKSEFDSFFKYRLELIFKNSVINSLIFQQEDEWKNLHKLIKMTGITN